MFGILQTIVNFFKAIWDAFKSLFKWLGDAFDALIEFLMNLPAWVFSKLAEGIVSFFESIPVPDFFATAANAFGSVPSEVVYFAETFQIGTGVTMVLGAYLLRFILRRIPFIG